MDIAVSGQPARRVPDAVRTLVRRGARVGHQCASVIGLVAIASVLALWMQPTWRTALGAKFLHSANASTRDNVGGFAAMNVLSVAPAGLGSGSSAASMHAAALLPTGANAADAAQSPSLGVFGAPLDPSNLPSVVRLARPTQVVAEARFDRFGAASGRDQQRVAAAIAQRYHIAQEPIDVLVHAAFQTGRDVGIDPLLLLAVMAVESGFNPYAESGVGARGLMQVMPVVHADKFGSYGGPQAALEPVPNLRVGALILKDYIIQTGSVAGGLRRYVGSTTAGDNGYGARVVAERDKLRDALRSGGTLTAKRPAPVLTASVKPKVVQTHDVGAAGTTHANDAGGNAVIKPVADKPATTVSMVSSRT
ncbi:transglycosylase SLT domain-containing protein [Robbsia sp. KACC 23696]|uniref:transglycosylase SLT domain-containing protein n=1 Tax=Robbsia sp. KACC 23696 TaxID=3149231 RepID=UPI00325B2851